MTVLVGQSYLCADTHFFHLLVVFVGYALSCSNIVPTGY
jgi:hypothetical protein